MSFKRTEENVVMNSKVLAANVIDASSGAQWYESRFFYESVIDGAKIWGEIDRLKTLQAQFLSEAVLAAGANTDIIEDVSSTAGVGIQLTEIPGTNRTTWAAYTTQGDPSSDRVDNWIQPQIIPLADGTPSQGYEIEVYIGGDKDTGTRLTTFKDVAATGNVSWVFNYSMGLLLLSEDYVAANVPAGSEIWVYGFRYIGPTGGSSEATGESLPYCAVYEVTADDPLLGLTVEKDPLNPLDPGVRIISTEAPEVTLKLVWERLTDEGLGFSGVLPTINGVAIAPEDITSTNMFDKVLYAEVVYTIADGDITLGHNGETMVITVDVVTKPTADITFSLPVLPWDALTEQTEAKAGDAITVIVNNASEELDMVKVIGGDAATYITSTTLENAEVILDTDVDYTSDFIIDNTETGNRSLEIYVRAKATKAWSLATIFGVDVDNVIPGTSSYVVNYPVGQTALKDSEAFTIDATGIDWDTATFTAATDADLDIAAPTFVSDDVANTWTLSNVATSALAGSYRYEDVLVGEVTYRKSNGMEETQQYNVKVSNEYPVPTFNPEPVVFMSDIPSLTTVTWDQPVQGYIGTIVSSPVLLSVAYNGSSEFELSGERSATDVPQYMDVTINDVQGPSLLPAVQRIYSNKILLNGFDLTSEPLRIVLPSGGRTGNIPIQVDLDALPGTFEINWNATETYALEVTFDDALSGTITADKKILLTQNPDGTLDFEIILSDTTILETTLEIKQAGL